MKRGFGVSPAGVVGFCGAAAAGFVTNVFGGAAGFGGSATDFAGATGAAGGSLCCVTAFSTSPGFEIFERSIFGRNSGCPE
jgi:hypothetical protein